MPRGQGLDGGRKFLFLVLKTSMNRSKGMKRRKFKQKDADNRPIILLTPKYHFQDCKNQGSEND